MILPKITLALALGILLSSLFAPSCSWLFLIAPLFSLCTFLLLRKRRQRFLEIGFQSSLFVTFTLLGICLHSVDRTLPGNHVKQLIGKTVEIVAKAATDSRPTPYGWKITLDCERLVTGGHEVSGSVLAYLPTDCPEIMEGDRLRLRIRFQPIKTKFEGYRRYLHRKGIFLTGKVLGIQAHERGHSPKAKAAHLRNGLRGVFQGQMPDQHIAGLATAIFLGDKSRLEKGIREAYAQAGMSHILAISGLHVGIIFVFLNKVLSFMAFSRVGRILRAALVMALLLGYMFMTGCAPAVCRAVLMIGIVQVGKVFYRQAPGMNSLAAAGLILLILNPTSLMDVGFQLSFSAVAGILRFAPKLQSWAAKRWKWGNSSLVKSASVCIAAQIFTAPLVFHHFGTFPTYFLFANLLLLPIAAFSVNLGFVSLILCWIPGLNTVLLGMLDFCLWILTALTGWFAHLPASTFTRLSISDPGFSILLCMLAGAMLVWAWPRLKPILSTKAKTAKVIAVELE